MSDEATEEKKGKKKKEKKPKKEKPPKEKKPKKEKPPKPKKEKKPKKGKEVPEGAEGEEGGKKKGPPLLLILIPVFVVVIVAAAVVIFVVLPKLRGKPAADDIPPDDPDAALSAQLENTERAKQGNRKDADAEPPPDSDAAPEPIPDTDTDAESISDTDANPDGESETPPPEEENKSVDIVVSMTTSECIDYFRSLPPAALGLPGESMADYDIFASEHLILVDDVPCKEFHVYSVAGKAGTNDVQGLYLLTQRGARKIYKLDEATNTVTELNWTPPRPEPEPEPVPEPEDGAEITDEAEPS